MDILDVKNLTKRFNGFTAVDDISFSLKEGEILGLLGRNGAGKTTTIQMLLGTLKPTEGEISYFGKDMRHFRSEIMENVNFSSTYTEQPWYFKVKECFYYMSYLYDIKDRKKRIEKIAQIFRFEDLMDKTVSQLSAGQKTRLNLAKAFLNFPKVLLLDEPTASLDPETADFIRKFLLEERKNFQVSIVFTSHNMSEVEEVCDRIIFIDHGKIIADDTPINLTRSIEICHISVLVKSKLEKAVSLCEKKKITYKISGKYLHVDVKEKEIAGFLKHLSEEDIDYHEISIDKPDLEDYFMTAGRKNYETT